MRNMWKTALAITLVLGLWGAAAQAQPLIAGNTAAFGNGPITTWDFSGVLPDNGVPDNLVIGSPFTPEGAIPSGTYIPNGRGLAIGGENVYYTELSGKDSDGNESYGPTDFIRIAPFNAGAGGTTDNGFLPNPRQGSGIQDLTIFNSRLYSLTGYPDQPPVVFVQDLNGTTFAGPIPIPSPASTDSDGFAVLPNGNFLINRFDTSCTYDEYDKADGHFTGFGNTINVPGAIECTGVDTDGTSLFFMTDFSTITKTDFFGNLVAFVLTEGDYDTEDISLVHPVTSITSTGNGHFFFSLRNTDDIGSRFDFRTELLNNGTVVGTAVTLCKVVNARAIPGNNVPVAVAIPGPVPLASGDVLSMRVSVRRGTNPDGTQCPGHFAANAGLRFFYDSTRTPSQFDMTIAPSTSPSTFYLHSDGSFCTDNPLGESQPTATLNRSLSDIPSVIANVRCKEVAGNITFAGGNPWNLFSTWSLLPLP